MFSHSRPTPPGTSALHWLMALAGTHRARYSGRTSVSRRHPPSSSRPKTPHLNTTASSYGSRKYMFFGFTYVRFVWSPFTVNGGA